jgi:hypothetical protein
MRFLSRSGDRPTAGPAFGNVLETGRAVLEGCNTHLAALLCTARLTVHTV